MIARTWRGATRAADAERYAECVARTSLAEYRTAEHWEVTEAPEGRRSAA